MLIQDVITTIVSIVEGTVVMNIQQDKDQANSQDRNNQYDNITSNQDGNNQQTTIVQSQTDTTIQTVSNDNVHTVNVRSHTIQ
jgi:hypothetical protein